MSQEKPMERVDQAISKGEIVLNVGSHKHCLCKDCLRHVNANIYESSTDCFVHTTGLTEKGFREIIVFLGPAESESPINGITVMNRSGHAVKLINFITEQWKANNDIGAETQLEPFFIFGDRVFTIEREHQSIVLARNVMTVCNIRYGEEYSILALRSINWVQ